MSEMKVLRLGQVRSMSADELEPWWRADFNTLVTTSIADAAHIALPGVSARLRSDDWYELWREALQNAEFELTVAAERMEYTRDSRLDRTVRNRTDVRRALDEARRVYRERKAEEGRKDPTIASLFNADETALSWLRLHRKDEAASRMTALLTAAGLPEHPPTHGLTNAEDGLHALEILIEQGIHVVERPPEVNRLLALDDDTFRNVVARDVSRQRERIDVLRHPSVMHDWRVALEDLQEMTGPRALANTSGGLDPLDMQQLRDMNEQEAYGVLNARRFYGGVRLRMIEWQRLLTTYGRLAARIHREHEAPWDRLRAQVRRELAAEHPAEYTFLRQALDPFCNPPGSSTLTRQTLPGHTRGSLKRALLADLDSGAWLHQQTGQSLRTPAPRTDHAPNTQ